MEPDTTIPQWLDKDFVQSLLREQEKGGVLIVKDVEVRSALGKGENYASRIHRVTVNLTKAGKQEQCFLIVKSLPTSEFIVKFIMECGIFEKETQMYLETLPAMHKLLEDSPNRSDENKTLCCRGYKTTQPYTIVLEDLKQRGYKMAQRHNGLDLKHATIAIQAMARLHALSIGLMEKDPKCFESYSESIYTADKRETTRQMVEPTTHCMASVIEKWEGYERFGNKLRSINFTDRMIKLFRISGGIAVLNHGDSWVNNMMFKYSDTGDVEGIKFVDFQMSRYASPGLDIQYFMYTSPSQEIRFKHWDTLLEEYHKEFVGTLKAIGSNPEVMSLEELKKEVDDKVLYGLLTACFILPIILADTADAPDMDQVKESNFLDAPEAANEMTKTYSGKRFRGVFEKMLLNFEQIGIF